MTIKEWFYSLPNYESQQFVIILASLMLIGAVIGGIAITKELIKWIKKK
jgi:hypothetical protein